MTLELRAVAWDDPTAEALRRAQRAEVDGYYGDEATEPGPTPSAADIDLMLVALVDGVPAGCGALRALAPDHGEVKRMYVVPAHRGTGLSSAILAALERVARERGWQRLLLETGDRLAPAIRFYEREGYRRVPLFGHYVGSTVSVCFEKRLDAPGRRPR